MKCLMIFARVGGMLHDSSKKRRGYLIVDRGLSNPFYLHFCGVSGVSSPPGGCS